MADQPADAPGPASPVADTLKDVAQSARASITSVAESKVMQDAAAAASAAKSKTRASIVAITESETAKAAAATAGKAAADASSGLNSVGQKLSALISPVVDASDAALVRVGAAAGSTMDSVAASSVGQKVNSVASATTKRATDIFSVTAKRPVVSLAAPKPTGPYNHAVTYGNPVWISGQIGLDPETAELVAGGVGAQTEQAMRNLGAVLTAAGCTHDDLVKTTVILASMSDYDAVNDAYAKSFSAPAYFPATACFAVSALPKGALVQIEGFALSSS